jgi:hypothetical protein
VIALKCANNSSSPSSGLINPKPFASLNHLTTPVAMRTPLQKIFKNNREAMKYHLIGLTPQHA